MGVRQLIRYLLLLSIVSVFEIGGTPTPVDPRYVAGQRGAPTQVVARWKIDDTKEEQYDLDYYLIVNDAFVNNINSVEKSINESKTELIREVNIFRRKVVEDIDTFNMIASRDDSKSEVSKCESSDNGKCNITNCQKYLPDKNGFIKSFELFSKILVYEFDKNSISLGEQLVALNGIINATRSMIHFKRSKAFLKKTAADELKTWETETIRKLDDMYYRIWKLTASLNQNFVTLGQRIEEMERNFVEEIKQIMHKFACCSKKFEFQVVGLYCDKS